MSSPGPPGGTGTGPKKTKVKKKVTKKKKEDDDKVRKDGSATDETASNSDRRDEAKAEAPPERKPQSAGASMRDAAQRILTLALKGEWTAVEGVIKSLEKAVEKAKAAAEEEVYFAPMAGVCDPVSSKHGFFRSSFL
ncbi:hypothetical protein PVAND_004387 [Polypedilum vanderplanki]|uniref:Uncharacterized protein n=1 Tax=Polypedilum vanderplanki TaxID=319348 RepID=A0A9J6BYZ8_POLVA|nr:hypothetical protein PVAND_004387 [Polypedilum vanderplanki]